MTCDPRGTLTALCQCAKGCGKLGPVHVVRTMAEGRHGEMASTPKVYAPEHCPVCVKAGAEGKKEDRADA
jgi:hypothetical protein